jgi:hypothetical protein
VYYGKARGVDASGKPFELLGLDGDLHNEAYLMDNVTYMNPNGTPENEVAMVCSTGTGVMMEWERPISMPFYILSLYGSNI